MASRIDAVAAGVTCVDIAPKFSNDPSVTIRELFRPSSTILTGKLTITPGGSASNTGLGLCRLGCRTRIMGRIGRDELGDLLLRKLEPYTDTSSFQRVDDQGTSYSLVIAPEGIDRFFIHSPGANTTYTSGSIDYGLVKEARLFHFGYLPVMESMCEDHGREAVSMYRRVHEGGTATSMDTCMPDVTRRIPDGYWTDILKRVLPYVDLFEPSVEELCFMISPERYRTLKEKGGKRGVVGAIDWAEIESYADLMLKLGAGVVLVKCGTKGMFLKAGGRERLEKAGASLREILYGWEGKKVIQKCFRPDRFVNSNGAGDVSIASFLTAALRGFPAEKAVSCAAAAGAECCESGDPTGALTDFDTLLTRMERGWQPADY